MQRVYFYAVNLLSAGDDVAVPALGQSNFLLLIFLLIFYPYVSIVAV
jgi:hypothetical protein